MELKAKTGEPKPLTIDEELAALQTRFRQLKTQYELFFSGILPRPPVEVRDRMNKRIRTLGERKEMKLAQRFVYNNFVHRWNTFCELWNRRMLAREEGPRQSAIARRRAVEAPSPPPSPSQKPSSPKPPQGELVARAAIRDAVDSGADDMKAFYRAFLDARREVGGGKPPSFERFCREIEKHAEVIRRKSSCERVDFRLYLQDNKVSLKAKPLNEEESTS